MRLVLIVEASADGYTSEAEELDAIKVIRVVYLIGLNYPTLFAEGN